MFRVSVTPLLFLLWVNMFVGEGPAYGIFFVVAFPRDPHTHCDLYEEQHAQIRQALLRFQQVHGVWDVGKPLWSVLWPLRIRAIQPQPKGVRLDSELVIMLLKVFQENMHQQFEKEPVDVIASFFSDF